MVLIVLYLAHVPSILTPINYSSAMEKSMMLYEYHLLWKRLHGCRRDQLRCDNHLISSCVSLQEYFGLGWPKHSHLSMGKKEAN